MRARCPRDGARPARRWGGCLRRQVWRRCRDSARTARAEVSSAADPSVVAAANRWMMPGSTPAIRSRSRSCCSTGTAAVTSNHSTAQPQPHRRAAARCGQPHAATVERERAVVPAQREQPPTAPRVPRRLARGAPSSGLEPRVGVAAQHRPCPHDVQLAHLSAGELPAQGLVVDQRRAAATRPFAVQLDQRRPHIAAARQHPQHPSTLRRGGPHANPRRAEHRPRRIDRSTQHDHQHDGDL